MGSRRIVFAGSGVFKEARKHAEDYFDFGANILLLHNSFTTTNSVAS